MDGWNLHSTVVCNATPVNVKYEQWSLQSNALVAFTHTFKVAVYGQIKAGDLGVGPWKYRINSFCPSSWVAELVYTQLYTNLGLFKQGSVNLLLCFI
ncbi:hypothetical protein XELAEV_18035478mg [Xenopus laevis]|uniref:Uncharacterized protein n=1 Tax=Xenopus laevis TaxID=8355 RepID=A0A974HC55_XENLA|nr:hypothetical protein XELAEV_18035478mg [Xenopus laevis]